MQRVGKAVRIAAVASVFCGLAAASPPAWAQSANLGLVGTDAPDPVSVGANLTYTLTVTNNGPSTAAADTLTDRGSHLQSFSHRRRSQVKGMSSNVKTALPARTHPTCATLGGPVATTLATDQVPDSVVTRLTVD
jgi:hypothetical protein